MVVEQQIAAPLLPPRPHARENGGVNFGNGAPLSIAADGRLGSMDRDQQVNNPGRTNSRKHTGMMSMRPATALNARGKGSVRIDKRTRTDTLVHKTRWSRCCYAAALLSVVLFWPFWLKMITLKCSFNLI